MCRSSFWNGFPRYLQALGIVLCVTLPSYSQPCCLPSPQRVADLRKLSPEQLDELFRRSSVGNIPVGDLNGRMIYLADDFLPRTKVFAANLVWRGKYLEENTYFANRWIGNRRRIGSCYGIGPSWVDGRPAVILEYPPGTPLFANMHDELREIAPGLYLGIVFEKEPCPKFRGYFAIEVPRCNQAKWRGH